MLTTFSELWITACFGGSYPHLSTKLKVVNINVCFLIAGRRGRRPLRFILYCGTPRSSSPTIYLILRDAEVVVPYDLSYIAGRRGRRPLRFILHCGTPRTSSTTIFIWRPEKRLLNYTSFRFYNPFVTTSRDISPCSGETLRELFIEIKNEILSVG